MADDLIAALREWAGFPLGERCAKCRQPFYNANALPVCYGCRRDAMRASLLALLLQRDRAARDSLLDLFSQRAVKLCAAEEFDRELHRRLTGFVATLASKLSRGVTRLLDEPAPEPARKPPSIMARWQRRRRRQLGTP